MEFNPDKLEQMFPETNELFAKVFFEMTERHIADHALPVNLLKEKVFFAKDFKEKHYAMNSLKTLAVYSMQYNNGTYHSPYTTLVPS